MNERTPDSWLARNWKWLVPTGCLTLIVLAVGFAAMLFVLIFSAMRSTEAYRTAMRAATANSELIAAIGQPITPGTFVSGEFNESGASGEANLAIPVSGPAGKATVYVVATKSAGLWTYTTLVAEVEATGRRIELGSEAVERAE